MSKKPLNNGYFLSHLFQLSNRRRPCGAIHQQTQLNQGIPHFSNSMVGGAYTRIYKKMNRERQIGERIAECSPFLIRGEYQIVTNLTKYEVETINYNAGEQTVNDVQTGLTCGRLSKQL